jgi:hypothetical protein
LCVCVSVRVPVCVCVWSSPPHFLLCLPFMFSFALSSLPTGALFVACKYEEVKSPDLRDFVYITDGAFTVSDFLQMETIMLNTLNFELSIPTAFFYANKYTQLSEVHSHVDQSTFHNLVFFLMELFLCDHKFLRYRPNTVARGAVRVARRFFDLFPVLPSILFGLDADGESDYLDEVDGVSDTNINLVQPDHWGHLGDYTEARWVSTEMTKLWVHADPRHKAVRKKYMHTRYGGIAHFVAVSEEEPHPVCKSLSPRPRSPLRVHYLQLLHLHHRRHHHHRRCRRRRRFVIFLGYTMSVYLPQGICAELEHQNP